MKTEYCSCSRE